MNHVIFFTILLISTAIAENSESCDSLGLQCTADCKHVEYCGPLDEKPLNLRTCQESSFCTFKKGIPQCDAKSCPNFEPECSVMGSLPVLDDCRKYVTCTGPGKGVIESCPNGEIFDVTDQKCKLNIKCRKSSRCRRAGDYGFVDSDTKIFCYYCKERNTPFVYPCNLENFNDQ